MLSSTVSVSVLRVVVEPETVKSPDTTKLSWTVKLPLEGPTVVRLVRDVTVLSMKALSLLNPEMLTLAFVSFFCALA